jgi:DNA-binding LacI/PurR family transcriptional regulator
VKRPTIHDIARAAGISTSAVSLVLNDQPGVSAATRTRVLDLARSLGWHPSAAARALRGGGAGTVGLVVARPASLLGTEPYFMQLVAGIEEELGPRHISLVLHVIGPDSDAEPAVYPRWWSQGRVDGVFLVDLRRNDPRLPVLAGLGMPALVLSRPQSARLPALWVDDAAAMRRVVDRLAELGHRRIAHVAGLPDLVQTTQRRYAFTRRARARGLTDTTTVTTDYSAESGQAATRRLLTGPRRPTAIVYDNDVMAVASLRIARELGIRVPAELSLVAWDDSALCRYVEPALTAVQVDVSGFGTAAARTLLAVIAGTEVDSRPYRTPALVERASTAPA